MEEIQTVAPDTEITGQEPAVETVAQVEEPKKEEPKEKTFTQAEVDEIVAKRLARVPKATNDSTDWQKKVDELQEKIGNYEKDIALKDAKITAEYFDFVKFQVSKQATEGKDFKTALNEYLAGEGKKYVEVAEDKPATITMTRPENIGKDDERTSYESMMAKAMKI